MHAIHALDAQGICGLAAGGVVSGQPLLSHAAFAPFSMMGAAQSLIHSQHARNAAQAAALRRFVASLPEVEQFAKAGNLSPQNGQHEIQVLSDLVSKAQALGETELKSDPGFQGALKQLSTRFGVSLGLDTVGQAINQPSKNPAAVKALPKLREQLAQARSAISE